MFGAAFDRVFGSSVALEIVITSDDHIRWGCCLVWSLCTETANT